MPGKAPRQKGDRFERQTVNDCQDVGIAAERVPLSGSAGGSYAHDVTVPVQGDDWKAECKCRKDGFATLYDWLTGNRLLFLKRDRGKTLVVMSFEDFAMLAKLPPDFVERNAGTEKESLSSYGSSGNRSPQGARYRKETA